MLTLKSIKISCAKGPTNLFAAIFRLLINTAPICNPSEAVYVTRSQEVKYKASL